MATANNITALATLKACSKCRFLKAPDEFAKHPRSQCKKCRYFYKHIFYLKNRERYLADQKVKRIQRRERTRIIKADYYRRNRDRLLEYTAIRQKEKWPEIHEKRKAKRAANLDEIRAKERAYGAIRRKKNKKEPKPKLPCISIEERIKRSRLTHKMWRQRNKSRRNYLEQCRRNRIKTATFCDFTDHQWQELLATFNYHCAYCLKYFAQLTRDHLIPVVRGGDHTLVNIVPACRGCNSSKHDKTLLEFVLHLNK